MTQTRCRLPALVLGASQHQPPAPQAQLHVLPCSDPSLLKSPQKKAGHPGQALTFSRGPSSPAFNQPRPSLGLCHQACPAFVSVWLHWLTILPLQCLRLPTPAWFFPKSRVSVRMLLTTDPEHGRTSESEAGKEGGREGERKAGPQASKQGGLKETPRPPRVRATPAEQPWPAGQGTSRQGQRPGGSGPCRLHSSGL